jgi:DNA gyrase inhibitor GyrI
MQRITLQILMPLRISLLVVVVTVLGVAWAWCGPHRDHYESAPYEVLSKSGQVEIRQYPSLGLASSSMVRAEKSAMNRSFRSLFGYISGANEGSSKISMTTPVFMEEQRMSFVLPEDLAKAGAPVPAAKDVTLEKFPGGKFAVLRFAGTVSSLAEEKAVQRLRQWAQENNMTLRGPAIFAYYDPPFTLPPFRRNEVLFRID